MTFDAISVLESLKEHDFFLTLLLIEGFKRKFKTESVQLRKLENYLIDNSNKLKLDND
jgi:hypothetical protein